MNFSKILNSRNFNGCPTFFWANCLEARQGGKFGYFLPGWHLSIHIGRLCEPMEDSELVWWKIRFLLHLLSINDNKLVIKWFNREFPGCMELIPRKRFKTFLKGVYDAYEAGRIEY
jgi:hypothetical protein